MFPNFKKDFYYLLSLIFILNLFDLVATLRYVELYGYQVEGNPLMRFFLFHDARIFVVFKVVVVLFFVIVMLKAVSKNYSLAFYGTALVTVVYLLLAYYHAIFFSF